MFWIFNYNKRKKPLKLGEFFFQLRAYMSSSEQHVKHWDTLYDFGRGQRSSREFGFYIRHRHTHTHTRVMETSVVRNGHLINTMGLGPFWFLRNIHTYTELVTLLKQEVDSVTLQFQMHINKSALSCISVTQRSQVSDAGFNRDKNMTVPLEDEINEHLAFYFTNLM